MEFIVICFLLSIGMSVRAVFSVLLNPLSDTLKNYTCNLSI